MWLWVYTLTGRYTRVLKFILSGCVVAVVNLVILYVLTDHLAVWYLTASLVAHVISVVLNFYLQKYWTFEDRTTTGTTIKMGLFFASSIVYAGLNALLMYAFVDGLRVWYLLAQVLTMGILMILNYLFYRRYIFT